MIMSKHFSENVEFFWKSFSIVEVRFSQFHKTWKKLENL